MRGKWLLFVDQYGQCLGARTQRELQRKAGGGRVSRMYVDGKDGKPLRVGYVVGRRWFESYQPFQWPL